MEHSLQKAVKDHEKDFSRRHAAGLHGRSYGFFLPKEHGSKQAVFKQDAAHGKDQNGKQDPCGKLSVPDPEPDKRHCHIRQDKKAKIGKIGYKRIEEQSHIERQDLFKLCPMIDPSEKINN